jgi:ketosteroid isomerase-like protein
MAPIEREADITAMGTAAVDDQRRAIQQWPAAWSAHDMGQVLRLFTEDVIYEDVTMGAVNRGHAEPRTFGDSRTVQR